MTEPKDVPAGGGDQLTVQASVRRGDLTVSADFTVAPGEVLGVLGPNGAGKTTLLRALAGLERISTGLIQLGADVLDRPDSGVFVPTERRPVGLVFQNYRLFPHLSVRANVAFGLRAQGHGRSDARAETERLLDRFGLADLADRRPGQLSGGQAQRVALARALAAGPRLLLFDEPLAALDARTRMQVRTELRRQLADFGGPTLLVTHDPLEALVMTDRIMVVEDGRVVQTGRPAEVARRPATEYVARLVGLNLYAGQRHGDAVSLDSGGRFVVHHDAVGPDDEAVLVALRPSAIAIHTRPPTDASPRNVWPGRVSGLELLADRVRIEVTGSPCALVDVTTAAVSELGLAAKQDVWLSAKATEIDVYPAPEPG